MDDPWIIFLHGLGGDAHSWAIEQKLLYEQGYPSISLDLRGHGLSDDPPSAESYVLERLAQDVGDLARHAKLNEIFLAGHCFGGMVSIVAAAEKKVKLRGLVLIDTTDKAVFLRFKKGLPNRFIRVMRKMAYLLPERNARVHSPYEQYADSGDFNVRRLIADIRATSLRSYLMCCSQAFSYDATHLLEKITIPTLVISGEKDSIFPPEVARSIADRIKNADLTIVPEANHIIVISKPHDIAEIIHQFLSKL